MVSFKSSRMLRFAASLSVNLMTFSLSSFVLSLTFPSRFFCDSNNPSLVFFRDSRIVSNDLAKLPISSCDSTLTTTSRFPLLIFFVKLSSTLIGFAAESEIKYPRTKAKVTTKNEIKIKVFPSLIIGINASV